MSAWWTWADSAIAQDARAPLETTTAGQETPPSTPPPVASATDAPERAASYLLRLGDHLLSRDMHYRALGAYEELAWSTDDETTRKAARLRIALAYHAGGRYDEAIQAYDTSLRLQLDPETTRIALVQLFVAQFGRYVEHGADEAIGDIRSQLAPLTADPGTAGELARYHDTRMRLFESMDTDLQVPVPAMCAERHDAICSGHRALHIAAQTERPSERSPWLAALLSAFVPGLGSAYSGHYVDGLYYFILSGGSAALALNVYDRTANLGDQKAAVYVLGTIAVATYVASLFGASLSAQRHNAIARYKHRRNVLDQTPEVLPLLDQVREQ